MKNGILKVTMVRAIARALVVFLLVGLAPRTVSAVAFNPVYLDGANEGFNDPTLGASRKSAFQFALNIWSGLLANSYVGETINIQSTFDPLGGSLSSAVLGQAGAINVLRDFGSASPEYQVNTWYGGPLANHLFGTDVIPGTNEMVARFNSDVDNSTVLGATSWYYGSNGIPGGNIDFVTVALHEVGHGLNFFDLINHSTGAFVFSGLPGIYDRFLTKGSTGGTPLTAMTDAQRLTALTSNDLYWFGPDGVAGDGGSRPKIWAPSPFKPGSSISHLDETTLGSELMSPVYSGADHTPSAIELGMLSDMGWTLVPEPGAFLLLAAGLVALRFTLRREAAPPRRPR